MSETMLGVLIGGAFGFLGALLGILGTALIEKQKERRERLQAVRLRLVSERVQSSEVMELVRAQRRRRWPRVWIRRQPDLSRADLREASLIGIDLRQVHLVKAQLAGASLQRANLRLANLREADLRAVKAAAASFQGADLSEAQLAEGDLGKAQLQGVRAEGAVAPRARLAGARLGRAHLVRADLHEACVAHADLSGANLNSADLRGACLEGATLCGAQFFRARLEGADLRWTSGDGVGLAEARLDGAVLRWADFDGGNFVDASLRGANLLRASLRGANLVRADLRGALLDEANLLGAVLDLARLDESTVLPDGSRWSPAADLTRFTRPPAPAAARAGAAARRPGAAAWVATGVRRRVLAAARAALTAAALAAAPSLAVSAAAAPPEFKPSLELRLRGEAFDTPLDNPARGERYEFGSARLRVGGNVIWNQVTLRGVLQGAATAGLPENAAFGAGQAYVAANGGDTELSQVGLAELSVEARAGGWKLVLGRQAWTDGVEVMTGIDSLDGVKRRRVGDRLIGTWDWPNVGRRYDGATFAGAAGGAHLAGFALRPLAGGINYDDAFEPLDDVEVYGLTVTGRYGAWIPKSELRLFANRYDDERPGARAAARGALGLTTAGASLLAGGARGDLLVWGAVQRGSWGPADQQAWAFLVETGRELQQGKVKLALRGGFAAASGDDPATREHETFFNLLPTNHKWYGSMDYVAFSNVRNAYLEALWSWRPPWSLRIGLDRFDLARRGDAFYGGSGAFDEAPLGYAGRRPAGGFSARHLGDELDLELGWAVRKDLRLALGACAFWGGEAMREVFPADADGSWVYLQLLWTR
jgi:uncharacterized protein YjbI with pentapeptide repeats